MLSSCIFEHCGLEAAFRFYQGRRSRRMNVLLYLLYAGMCCSAALRMAIKLWWLGQGGPKHGRYLLAFTVWCLKALMHLTAAGWKALYEADFASHEKAKRVVVIGNVVGALVNVIMLGEHDMFMAWPVPGALLQAVLVLFSDARLIVTLPLYFNVAIAFLFMEWGARMMDRSISLFARHVTQFLAGLVLPVVLNYWLELHARSMFVAQQQITNRRPLGRFWACRIMME